MYDKVEKWLDQVLSQEIPKDVAAFHFNLYEDGGDAWSMELVGCERFDEEDEDWCCDEITDFGTREECFVWNQEEEWSKVLEDMAVVLKKYLESGRHADVLKRTMAVGAGFVDGDPELLYRKETF